MIAIPRFTAFTRGTVLVSFVLLGFGCGSGGEAPGNEPEASGGASPTPTTPIDPPAANGGGTANPPPAGGAGPGPEPTGPGPTPPPPPPADVELNLRGRITDVSGTGIKDCPVSLGAAKTLTGADGSYEIKMMTQVPNADPAENDVQSACRGYLTKSLPITSFDQDLGTTQLKRPNILIMMADDMNNWTSLTNDWVKTPNLKALAATGVAFERAHVPAQECNPSRTAILLGQRPSTTGMYWNGHNFREHPATQAAVTLPQYFKAEGYETVDAGKIYHQRTEVWDIKTGPGGGISVPPEYSANPWHKGDFAAKGDAYNEGAFVFGPTSVPEAQTGDALSAKFIGDYVKVAHDKPFFAACGFVKPHTPLIAPQKYFDMYPLNEVKLPEIVANDLDDVGTIGARVANNFGKNIQDVVLAHNVWPQAVQAYKAAASYTDANIGVVVNALDSGPNKDNTIVIFVSDHGVHLGTKEHWWKMTLWNETTRIPFVIRVPGVAAAGETSPRPVNAIDIFPTLLDLMNYPPKEGLDGRSLAPLLKDPDAAWEYPSLTTAGFKNHSVASEKYRYTKYLDGFEELYDQEADPNEFKNLASDPQYAAVIADHKKWLPATDAPEPPAAPEP